MKTITITEQGKSRFDFKVNRKLEELKNEGYDVEVKPSSMKLVDSPMGGQRETYTTTIIYKEKSTRKLALEWWNKLSSTQRKVFGFKYFDSDKNSNEEIEEIWKKETQDAREVKQSNIDFLEDVKQDEISTGIEFYKKADKVISLTKPNQKQFKEFNPELFKAYIDKFSDEDKFRIWELMFDIIPDGKKWDNINHNSPFYLHICRAFNAGKKQMKDQFHQVSDFQSSEDYYKEEFQ